MAKALIITISKHNHFSDIETDHHQSDAARSRAGNEISSNVDTEGTRRACRRGGETLEMPNVTTSKVRPKPQAIVCKQKPVLSKPSKVNSCSTECSDVICFSIFNGPAVSCSSLFIGE